MLASQLLSEEERAIMGMMVRQIENMVLEDECLVNHYRCGGCGLYWTSKKDWFDVQFCPKCKNPKVITIQERQSIYDIEFVFESNRDYTAYFERYGQKITRSDVERRLNRIKEWLFGLIREKSEGRRFKRFK